MEIMHAIIFATKVAWPNDIKTATAVNGALHTQISKYSYKSQIGSNFKINGIFVNKMNPAS